MTIPRRTSESPPPPALSNDELWTWYESLLATDDDIRSGGEEGVDDEDSYQHQRGPLPFVPPPAGKKPSIDLVREIFGEIWRLEHTPTPSDDIEGKSLKHRALHLLGIGHRRR